MAVYTIDELKNLALEAGLRVTNHRIMILQIIAKQKQAITAFELLTILRKKYSIDQATVYRNLLSLHEAGILRRLDFNHGHAHYELNKGGSSIQLVCETCETIEKIEGVSFDENIKKIFKKSKKFKTTNSFSVEIYGGCKKCA